MPFKGRVPYCGPRQRTMRKHLRKGLIKRWR